MITGKSHKYNLDMIAKLQREIKIHAESVDSLNHTVKQQKVVIDCLQAIENSLSWRMIKKSLDIFDKVFRGKAN
jgi:hypothetical protein